MDSEKAGVNFDGVFHYLCRTPPCDVAQKKKNALDVPKMLKNFAERQDRSMGGLRP
jgi:hypothetical protein